MPRQEDDDDLPDGVYHDDAWQTVPCRYCREDIAEDSDRCPHCGYWQSAEDAPSEPKSWFIWIVMAFALACAALWALGW